MDDAFVDLATFEPLARDTLERGSILVQIAQGLIARPERRLQRADLPDRAERQDEGDRLPSRRVALGYNPDTPGHLGAFQQMKSIRPRNALHPRPVEVNGDRPNATEVDKGCLARNLEAATVFMNNEGVYEQRRWRRAVSITARQV
jgi:hypothetical protein